MVEFGCDYGCGTVGEGIIKYNIPDDWCAEFDACDGVCSVIVIQVDTIRGAPAMMALKLRNVENPDDEYAGCVVFTGRKTIVFKVDSWRDLVKAMEMI